MKSPRGPGASWLDVSGGNTKKSIMQYSESGVKLVLPFELRERNTNIG